MLPDELQRDLNVEGLAGTDARGADGCAIRAANQPEPATTANTRVRACQIENVEDIEHLNPKLRREPLRDGSVFEYGEINGIIICAVAAAACEPGAVKVFQRCYCECFDICTNFVGLDPATCQFACAGACGAVEAAILYGCSQAFQQCVKGYCG